MSSNGVAVLSPIVVQASHDAMGILSFSAWGGVPKWSSIEEAGQRYANYVVEEWNKKLEEPDSIKYLIACIPDTWKYDQELCRKLIHQLAYQGRVKPYARTMKDLSSSGDLPPESATYDPSSDLFSGGAGTPFQMMSHYLSGRGTKVYVPINNLGLNISPNDININGVNQLSQYIYSPSIGSQRVSVNKFSYNTYKDSYITGSYIGNFSLTLEGDFTKNANGSWRFDGVIRAWEDKFDFNPSNHRGFPLEQITNMASIIPGTPFPIQATGELSISWTQDDWIK